MLSTSSSSTSSTSDHRDRRSTFIRRNWKYALALPFGLAPVVGVVIYTLGSDTKLPENTTPFPEQCGERTFGDDGVVFYVEGGIEAEPGEFPWQVGTIFTGSGSSPEAHRGQTVGLQRGH